MRPVSRREDFLSVFAPLFLAVFLVAWVVCLVLGYGMMLWGLGHQIRPVVSDLGSACYLAGTALFTLGFGDMVGSGAAARFVLLLDASSGLAVVALVISFLFTLHGSFQRREVLVLTLDDPAGAPPSGVTLLETYARLGMQGDLALTFRAWEAWCAEVLESHRASPLLPFFRSGHADESWVSALGAVLDAATLVLTVLEDGPKGPAHFTRSLGVHTVLDLQSIFGLPREEYALVSPPEFREAYCRLRQAGYPLVAEERAWEAFAAARREYAGPLNELARYFAIPAAQWVGDRSILPHQRHATAADGAGSGHASHTH
jgi:hypothetical protein